MAKFLMVLSILLLTGCNRVTDLAMGCIGCDDIRDLKVSAETGGLIVDGVLPKDSVYFLEGGGTSTPLTPIIIDRRRVELRPASLSDFNLMPGVVYNLMINSAHASTSTRFIFPVSGGSADVRAFAKTDLPVCSAGERLTADAGALVCQALPADTTMPFAKTALPVCLASEKLTSNGGSLMCEALPVDTTLAFAKTALPTCSGNQVLKSNGVGFSCVNPEDSGKLPLSGGTLGGSLNMSGNTVAGLSSPLSADHAVNLGFLDAGFVKKNGESNGKVIIGNYATRPANPNVVMVGGGENEVLADKVTMVNSFEGKAINPTEVVRSNGKNPTGFAQNISVTLKATSNATLTMLEPTTGYGSTLNLLDNASYLCTLRVVGRGTTETMHAEQRIVLDSSLPMPVVTSSSASNYGTSLNTTSSGPGSLQVKIRAASSEQTSWSGQIDCSVAQ